MLAEGCLLKHAGSHRRADVNNRRLEGGRVQGVMVLGSVVRDSPAMLSASFTSAVSHRRSIDQPTTRRLKASSTTQQ